MLAGLPNAPSIYQLSTGYEMAKQRQEWVLKTMQDNSWITEEERIEAMQEDTHPLNKP
jgi:membrane peptidoglycan carboxypeptidase